MANDHPFQTLFESLGHLPLAHAEAVNRQAYEILYDILTVPTEQSGRCILLRAPRAGHGKTHLLSRIQHHLGASHEFIPMRAAFGCQIDAGTVIDDALRRLLRPLPASGGLCVLDLVTRRLFALALQPLVETGEVPCQDREGALSALRARPLEVFDFHHPNAVTAHWARENFASLGQRFSVELAQRGGLPILEVAFWVDALFRFVATPAENTARLRVLVDEVHGGSSGESVMMERLEALLGMLSLLMRVVLVADNLEGFSSDETAALRLASFLGTLRQSVERLDVILSLNQDIWQSAFVPRLSGGLTDRLSEVVVELNPLTEEEMLALLESRVPGLGTRVLARVDRASAGTHARGLIRAAGIAWLRASAMDSRLAVPSAAPVAAIPEPPRLATPAPQPTPQPAEVALVSPTAIPAVSEPGSTPAAPPRSVPVTDETTETVPARDPVPVTTPVERPAPPAPVVAQAPPAQAPPLVIAAEVKPASPAPPAVPLEPPAPPQAAVASPSASAAASAPPPAPPAVPLEPPAPPAPGEPAASDSPPHPADPDRVDVLLKQFLERYGRDSQ